MIIIFCLNKTTNAIALIKHRKGKTYIWIFSHIFLPIFHIFSPLNYILWLNCQKSKPYHRF